MENSPLKLLDCNTFLQFNSAQLASFFAAQQQLVGELEQRLAERDKKVACLDKEVAYLKTYAKELEEKIILIDNQLVILKNKLFRRSSEKSAKKDPLAPKGNSKRPGKKKKKKIQLPSERYPDAPLIERHLELKDLPHCSCCGTKMADSGMTEDSEYLTVIPAEYLVIRQKRHKYRCTHCHGEIKTTPCPTRIAPGSTYSDEMILDVALTKYCDLVPIERYCSIAGREGFKDLPPHSLINTTHNLADFVESAYKEVSKEVCSSLVLNADETPHKMLEGDEKKNWYLWGFSTPASAYFEIHDTRSGDVASELLKEARCEYLVTDVFSGYRKAVREANTFRHENGGPTIKNVFCNAHSRRYFKEAAEKFPDEAEYFLERYRKIYSLENQGQEQTDQLQGKRYEMKALFEEMSKQAKKLKDSYSSKSSLVKACDYFLKNYNGLTLFLELDCLPIDNNRQERLLRNPVIGRKTWYGTHSRRGAQTAAILFSLVESCKLIKINPREYFRALIESLHQKKPPFTPKTYKEMLAETG